MERNWLLCDLDGTLLRSDKTISPRTLEVLERVRKGGYQIAVVTSRAEQNCMEFLADLHPDALITSAGALTDYRLCQENLRGSGNHGRHAGKTLLELQGGSVEMGCHLGRDYI